MTSPPVQPGHDAIRETSREWVGVCQPLATVIDAVMPADREALAALLEVLRTSSYRREARTVIRLLRLASDPRSDLGTMARNALRTWVQLQRLLEARAWSRPEEIVESPRATALLNLATAIVQGRYVPVGLAPSSYEPLLERLTAAAAQEREAHRRDVERILTIRAQAFPGLLSWLDRWLER